VNTDIKGNPLTNQHREMIPYHSLQDTRNTFQYCNCNNITRVYYIEEITTML